MLIHLVITTILGLKSLFYSHFTDKETKMQRLSTLLANEKKKKKNQDSNTGGLNLSPHF